jgi:hypothetical protein
MTSPTGNAHNSPHLSGTGNPGSSFSAPGPSVHHAPRSESVVSPDELSRLSTWLKSQLPPYLHQTVDRHAALRWPKNGDAKTRIQTASTSYYLQSAADPAEDRKVLRRGYEGKMRLCLQADRTEKVAKKYHVGQGRNPATAIASARKASVAMRRLEGLNGFARGGDIAITKKIDQATQQEIIKVYLFTDRVKGESGIDYLERLADEARRDPQKIPSARQNIADLIRQCFDRVIAMEERGVVHGNLCPQNLIHNQESGEVTVIDFGIIRLERPQYSQSNYEGLSGFIYSCVETLQPFTDNAGAQEDCVNLSDLGSLVGELVDEGDLWRLMHEHPYFTQAGAQHPR